MPVRAAKLLLRPDWSIMRTPIPSRAAELISIRTRLRRRGPPHDGTVEQVLHPPPHREDIHGIYPLIENVVDLTNAAAKLDGIFRYPQIIYHSVNLAKQAVRGCEKLADAVHGMNSTKNYDHVMFDGIAVHEVENAADDISDAALTESVRHGEKRHPPSSGRTSTRRWKKSGQYTDSGQCEAGRKETRTFRSPVVAAQLILTMTPWSTLATSSRRSVIFSIVS